MTYIFLDERLLAQLNTLHYAYAELARLEGVIWMPPAMTPSRWRLSYWHPEPMAERGRLYLWPRNRNFGDSPEKRLAIKLGRAA